MSLGVDDVGPVRTRTSLVAYGASVLTLLLGGAGLFAMTSSGTTTSLVRMGVAAGVLALLAGVVPVVVTPAADRTAARRWRWTLAVPGLVGAATGLLVGSGSGPSAGLLAALPWFGGAVLAGAVGPFLPDLSPHSWRRWRQERRHPAG